MDMLYVVPPSVNDDWFWLYVTVQAGRSRPAFVISNDLMRDHRLAFFEDREFLRWRSTQIVHFDFSRAAEDGMRPEELPECFLYDPNICSREMQFNAMDERWHIPAIDDRAWLCLKPLSIRRPKTTAGSS
jgi:Protein-only RNase P